MASKVSAKVVNAETAAACKFGTFHSRTFCNPVMEVVNPTTPAIRENIMKNPVAIFPIGKYIGNIRAGIDNTDAANPHPHTYILKFTPLTNN